MIAFDDCINLVPGLRKEEVGFMEIRPRMETKLGAGNLYGVIHCLTFISYVPAISNTGYRLPQVFGTKKLLWFVPLYSTEDLHNIPALRGMEFPTRSDAIV